MDQNQLNQLQGQLTSMAGSNPADVTMRAKQYFAPIVQPLVQEGGQRFSDFFSSLPRELLNHQGGIGGVSPLFGLSQAMDKVGQYGSLYDANLGMRNYYGTRGEDLAKTANDAVNTMYGRTSDLYKTGVAQNQYNQDFKFKQDQAKISNGLEQQRINAANAGNSTDANKIITDYFAKLGLNMDGTPITNRDMQYNTPIVGASTGLNFPGPSILNKKTK